METTTRFYDNRTVGRIWRMVMVLPLLLAATTAMAQVQPAALKAGAQKHPDSLAVDSALAQAQAGMMVPMALPSPPNISYNVPSVLQVGTPVSYSPTNTGGAVYADWDLTTFAGSTQGYANGTGTAAKFYYPSGIVSDGSGNLYVAEGRNHVIRKITPAGVVTTFAGSGVSGSANGTGTAASFNYPMGLAMDGSGNLYVVDRNNYRIRKITPAGVVTTLAGSTQGFANGTGAAAKFNAPADVAVDASGNLYVTDEQNHRIRKITPAGVVTTLAGSGVQGNANGTGTSAQFNVPQGLAIDPSGNLYVGDQVGNTIRKVTPAGVVTTFASITRPISLERDASGNLYAGLLGHKLARISTAGAVTTVAGTGTAGAENGPPLSAQLNFPGGVTFDPQGNRFIADMWNNRIRRMGTGQGYSISPALPAGMAFNKTTGVISGTPTAVTASKTYTVTARNAGGSDTYAVTFSVGSGGTPAPTHNYIQKTTYRGHYTTPPANPPLDSAMRDITYFDGLGRAVQEIQVKATPAGTKDVVTPITYDGFGRQDRDYLPYATSMGAGGAFKVSAVSDQADFYMSPPAGVVAIGAFGSMVPTYGQRTYEAGPQDRVEEQGFPGAAWQPAASRGTSGRTVVSAHTYNNTQAFTALDTTHRVARYGVALASGTWHPTLTLATGANGYYATGQLRVTITKDEDWVPATGAGKRVGTVEEYHDKDGRVVLRRLFNKEGSGTVTMLSTYYVYDDYGNLAFVLPPEAQPDRTTLPAAGAARDTWLANYAYRYQYDGRNRLIERQLPGKGREYMVYNAFDELVATQDSMQRLAKEWTVTKYDRLGRVVQTGIWNNGNAAITRAALQTLVNGWAAANLHESRTGTGNGYTNVAWPTSSITTTLTLQYYDDYSVPGFPPTYDHPGSTMTKGLPTVSRVKVLGAGTGTSNMLWDVSHYNSRGEVTKRFSQHYKGGGTANTNNYDETATAYTFTGLVKQTTRKHLAGGAQQVQVKTDYGYDHRDRLEDTWMQVNATGTPVLLSRNTYNEVGQLRTKGLSGEENSTGTDFGQVITYSYNERGWLRTSASPLFSEELRYDTGTAKYYNGNIGEQVFSRKHTTGATVSGTYSYAYDRINRLLKGTLAGNNGQEILTYDRNGNIKSLRRTDATGALVDRLRYDYGDWGNRLKSVYDSVGTTFTGDPFQLPGTTNYDYDGNGNLKSRLNTSTAATHKVNNISNVSARPSTYFLSN